MPHYGAVDQPAKKRPKLTIRALELGLGPSGVGGWGGLGPIGPPTSYARVLLHTFPLFQLLCNTNHTDSSRLIVVLLCCARILPS
jgi:hypothetical protein